MRPFTEFELRVKLYAIERWGNTLKGVFIELIILAASTDYTFLASFAHASFNVTVLLKTIPSSEESLSRQ